jgi:hypothetical protein
MVNKGLLVSPWEAVESERAMFLSVALAEERYGG